MTHLQKTLRSMSDSPALNKKIHKYYQRLTRINPRIIQMHVILDIDHKHKHKGKLFSAKVDAVVPGKEVVSKKEHENPYKALHECFHAIEKMLVKNRSKLISKHMHRAT